jgi:hypothetical protein
MDIIIGRGDREGEEGGGCINYIEETLVLPSSLTAF